MGGGGVVQNRESPDFRSPEVGRYAFRSDFFAVAARLRHEISYMKVFFEDITKSGDKFFFLC